MKTFILIVCLAIFMACSNKFHNTLVNDVEMVLNNNSLKDSSDIELTIFNNSSTDYYFFIDTSKLYYSELFISEFARHLDARMFGKNNVEIEKEYVDDDCEYFAQRNKTKTDFNDILKIKAKSKKKFKMPFRLRTVVNNTCWFGFEKDMLNANDKYYVDIMYRSMADSVDIDRLISKQVKDSLNKQNFKLYTKEMHSNRVSLYLE